MPMQKIFSGAKSGGNSSTSASGMSGRTPAAAALASTERLGAKDLEQGGEAAQPRAQIDDALADDRAETRPAAQIIACKPHVRFSRSPHGGRRLSAFRAMC